MIVRKREPTYNAFRAVYGASDCRESDTHKGMLEVPIGRSILLVVPGRWVLTDDQGTITVCTDDDFHRLYERV